MDDNEDIEDDIIDEPKYINRIKRPDITYNITTEQKNKSTSNILTDYEYAQCISIRAAEIERGGKIFTDYTGLSDPISIAKKEFSEKNTPMYLVRLIKTINGKNIIDRWELSKMSCFE